MKQPEPGQMGLWGDEPFAEPESGSAWGAGSPAASGPGGAGRVPSGASGLTSPASLPPDDDADAPAGAAPSHRYPERQPGTLPHFRHPQAEREIRLSKAVVGYEVKRARRRSIGMVVGVDGLSVRAPRWVSWSDIETALRAKERWICTKLVEQRERAQRQMSARIDWREGASVPYLGDSLVVVLDPRIAGGQLHEVLPDAGLPGVPQRTLHLGLPHQATPEQIRDVAEAWLQREAMRVFSERVPVYASQLGVKVRKLSLSSARTRWGSASADGSIRLHWRLVHFSISIIDYVVAHELAHLREMNHSPAFWDVVRSIMPSFDAPREQLRHVAIPD
ncbi:M48 family metallopeptidase [Aquabacterium sp.]|uniref:M48 family metallopeptidase n=1 Tax=Aquabacterium sp. TaxID=1872578 RepID=UPI0025C7011E|nr:SprT family zinc-dependent metalloprotease [Aquabacterium sp.]